MSETLDERISCIYGFIVVYKLNHDGCAPSIREIGAAIDVTSTSLIEYYLERMEDRRLIRRQYHIARTIEVIHNDSDLSYGTYSKRP